MAGGHYGPYLFNSLWGHIEATQPLGYLPLYMERVVRTIDTEEKSLIPFLDTFEKVVFFAGFAIMSNIY